MQEIGKQQNQHHQHHHNAEAHGQRELLEHFRHKFRVARFGFAHAGGQAFPHGQRVDFGQHFADGAAGRQIGFHGNAAGAVETLQAGRALRQGNVCHAGQRHAAALRGGHGKAFDGFNVVFGHIVQQHADGDLAVGQVEFGGRGFQIAHGGNPQQIAH